MTTQKGILGTFASEESNKMRLVLSSKVLESLLYAAQHDLDTDVRRRAMRTIRYLAQGGSQTATHITLRSMDILVQMLMSDNYTRRDDEDKNQIIGAFSSLSSLSTMIELPQPMQRSITITTVHLLLSSSNYTKKYTDNLVTALYHLSSIPKNYLWMLQDCTGLLDALYVVLSEKSSIAAVDNALKTLLNLAGENANLKAVGRHEKMMNSLAELASSHRSSSIITASRTFSVQAIVRLSEEPLNVPILAENPAILTSLVSFALDSPDDSLLKQRAKESLLRLVPDM